MQYKKFSMIVLVAVMSMCVSSCSKYETVKGDPMKAKIYTLGNGPTHRVFLPSYGTG